MKILCAPYKQLACVPTPSNTLQLCANINVLLKKHFAEEEEEMDSAFLNSQGGKLARLRNFLWKLFSSKGTTKDTSLIEAALSEL